MPGGFSEVLLFHATPLGVSVVVGWSRACLCGKHVVLSSVGVWYVLCQQPVVLICCNLMLPRCIIASLVYLRRVLLVRSCASPLGELVYHVQAPYLSSSLVMTPHVFSCYMGWLRVWCARKGSTATSLVVSGLVVSLHLNERSIMS